jgi:hypothetical protein
MFDWQIAAAQVIDAPKYNGTCTAKGGSINLAACTHHSLCPRVLRHTCACAYQCVGWAQKLDCDCCSILLAAVLFYSACRVQRTGCQPHTHALRLSS